MSKKLNYLTIIFLMLGLANTAWADAYWQDQGSQLWDDADNWFTDCTFTTGYGQVPTGWCAINNNVPVGDCIIDEPIPTTVNFNIGRDVTGCSLDANSSATIEASVGTMNVTSYFNVGL